MINQHPIFLGGERKTFDSLNKHYPKIFELYKQQKAKTGLKMSSRLSSHD